MTLARLVLYLVGLAASTLLIFFWNRGAQRRRFRRAYGTQPHPAWQPHHAPFLQAAAKAFHLPSARFRALPPTATPMSLYLVLYPEHCIYDDLELTHFLSLFPAATDQAPALLTTPFGTLADQWRA